AVIASLRHQRDTDSDWATVLLALGSLWAAGVEVDWKAYSADERRGRIALPTYPFQRRRYWVAPRPRGLAPATQQAASTRKPDGGDWFYVPSWRRTGPVPASAATKEEQPDAARWLAFLDDQGVGAAAVQRLQRDARDVVAVMAGAHFSQFGDDVYAINPGA